MANEKKRFEFELDAFEEHALLTAINTGMGVLDTKSDDQAKAVKAALVKLGVERGILQKVGDNFRWTYHPGVFTSTDRENAFKTWKRGLK